MMYCEIQFRMVDLRALDEFKGLDEGSCLDKLEDLVFKVSDDLFFNSSASCGYIGVTIDCNEDEALKLLTIVKSQFKFLEKVPIKYSIEQEGFWDKRK